MKRTTIRSGGRVLAGVLLLSLCAGARPVGAQSPPAESDHPVTALLTRFPLNRALKVISRAAGVAYRLDTRAVTVEMLQQRVSVNLHQKPVETVLSALLDQIQPPLTWRLDNGVYLITLSPNGHKSGVPADDQSPSPAQAPINAPKITLTLRGVDISTALDALCRRAQVNYVQSLAQAAPLPATFTLKNASFDVAVRQLLSGAWGQTVPLLSRIRFGVTVFYPSQLPPDVKRPDTLKVTLHLKDADAHGALAGLFAAGGDWTYAPNLQSKITLDLKSVPASEALKSVLEKAEPPLIDQVKEGVHTILLKP